MSDNNTGASADTVALIVWITGFILTVRHLVAPPMWYDWPWYFFIAWPWVAAVHILEHLGVIAL